MIVLPGGGQARVQSAVDAKAEQNFRGNAEAKKSGDLSTIVLTQLCNHTLVVFSVYVMCPSCFQVCTFYFILELVLLCTCA